MEAPTPTDDDMKDCEPDPHASDLLDELAEQIGGRAGILYEWADNRWTALSRGQIRQLIDRYVLVYWG